jgi:hypothetical protein
MNLNTLSSIVLKVNTLAIIGRLDAGCSLPPLVSVGIVCIPGLGWDPDSLPSSAAVLFVVQLSANRYLSELYTYTL